MLGRKVFNNSHASSLPKLTSHLKRSCQGSVERGQPPPFLPFPQPRSASEWRWSLQQGLCHLPLGQRRTQSFPLVSQAQANQPSWPGLQFLKLVSWSIPSTQFRNPSILLRITRCIRNLYVPGQNYGMKREGDADLSPYQKF